MKKTGVNMLSLVLASSMIIGGSGISKAADGVADNKPFVSGYSGTTLFKPDNKITRAEVSKLISVAYDIALSKSNFLDVADSHWAKEYIGGLNKSKIIEGYPDRTFKPDSEITRAEFAAVISRAAVDTIGSGEKHEFSDIDNHWAKDVITRLGNLGIITGYKNTTEFRPDNPITRAEAVTMILRALNRNIDEKIGEKVKNPFTDVKSDAWYYKNVLGASTSYKYSFRVGEETIYEEKEEGKNEIVEITNVELVAYNSKFDSSFQVEPHQLVFGEDVHIENITVKLEDGTYEYLTADRFNYSIETSDTTIAEVRGMARNMVLHNTGTVDLIIKTGDLSKVVTLTINAMERIPSNMSFSPKNIDEIITGSAEFEVYANVYDQYDVNLTEFINASNGTIIPEEHISNDAYISYSDTGFTVHAKGTGWVDGTLNFTYEGIIVDSFAIKITIPK